jgi:hypothetical protein
MNPYSIDYVVDQFALPGRFVNAFADLELLLLCALQYIIGGKAETYPFAMGAVASPLAVP